MGATTNVNNRTVVHKDSGGIATAFPDVCKTPVGPAVVPIPYPNIAKSSDTAKGSKKVKVDGNPIMLKGSNFSTSTGDEAGTAGGGVVSAKTKGKAEFINYSFDVKVEGKNVPRLADMMLQNCGSPPNTPPMPEVQSPLVVVGKDIKGEKEKIKKGNLVVKVIDNCDGNPVYRAIVDIGNQKKFTNKSGIAEFKKIPAKDYEIEVKKMFTNENYVTYITHYPKLTISHKPESEEKTNGSVEDKKTTDVEVKMEVFKLLDKVIFKRNHIALKGDDEYGHWWVVINDKESYGWWPKYPLGHPKNAQSSPPQEPTPLQTDTGIFGQISFMVDTIVYNAKKIIYDIREHSLTRTFAGVEGELNGQTRFGGTSTEDPHEIDGDLGMERYQPVINDCRKDSAIKGEIKSFVTNYVMTNKEWSWRFEFGKNCHTFQIEMIEKCDLKKLKEV